MIKVLDSQRVSFGAILLTEDEAGQEDVLSEAPRKIPRIEYHQDVRKDGHRSGSKDRSPKDAKKVHRPVDSRLSRNNSRSYSETTRSDRKDQNGPRKKSSLGKEVASRTEGVEDLAKEMRELWRQLAEVQKDLEGDSG